MSYTPNTWTTGDTITATKLNKIEQGIANAGSVVAVRLSAINASSSTKTFGCLVYAYNDNGSWIIQNDDLEATKPIYGLALPNDNFLIVPIPSDDNIRVYILDLYGASIVTTGGVSDVGETIYYSYGSVVASPAYRVTGNGTFCWDNG